MIDQIDTNQIKKIINEDGFYCLKDFINNEELSILREFVDSKIKENNNQYFFLTSENSQKTLLNNDNFFQKIEILLKKITTEYNYLNRENENLYKVLRVVTGKKSKKVSLDFHFDAHLLTLLIPIYIPNRINADNGNLIIIKNLRNITKNIFKNVLINKKLSKTETLYLKPGNAYIFNGFRTLHANLNIDPRDIRATILVHYYDIFKDSFLVKKNREMRIKRELKNIKSNQVEN